MAPSAFQAEGAERVLVGALALVVSVAVYARLLGQLRARDRATAAAGKTPPWWHGYTTDAANLGGLLAVGAGFLILGASPPVALLLGFLYCMVVYSLSWAMGDPRPPRAAAWRTAAIVATTVLLLAPFFVLPATATRAVATTVDVLFRHGAQP